jgi:tetratricopeptide (TPR) repeat protein
LNKGIILNKLGKYDEALKANDEALKLNPNMAKS